MAIDLFSVQVLNRVVADLRQTSSFLLDTFFPNEQLSDSEEIYFDVQSSKRRLAPFVSPLVEGKVVNALGYQTSSFRPAYVKDKRRFNPNAPIRRAIGERIGGELSPMQRLEILVRQELADQLAMLTMREEVMASEALRLGRVTVTGDQYPTQVVSFGRDPALTVALTGAARWGQSGVKPLDNLEDWAGLIQTKSGAAGTTVVMDPKAWRLFAADDGVQKLLDRQAYRGLATTDLEPRAAGGSAGELAQYRGRIGSFEFWTYQNTYTDENDATQQVLPDYTVIVGSRTNTEGVRCYGLIRDERAGFTAQRYFAKSWLNEDPAIRWLLLQSAPLVVPYRVNATFCATVN